ncbi:MAG: D-alanyl-D-alanine carboxypeptidase/D-alanyl-D-alanine-endopeptidase [Planctomycetes bacterium]|nr:D-alanyl-D-alanine carboxypeptidase/D-alanyl-D-alanine-endopeptidase [Planctomycetota bacterium]
MTRSGVAFLAAAWLLASGTAAAARDARADRFAAAAARLLAKKELSGATVGLAVHSLASGSPFYAHGAERGLAPASNLKLVTLYLAFATLGPDFQFETPVLADGPLVDGGRLEGSLWVRGSGDPSLRPCFFESEDDAAPLAPFVQALQLQGVRSVRGDLVVDARAFDGETIPQGWPRDQLGEEYAAPVAALGLNGNCVRVRVSALGDGGFLSVLLPEVAGWRVAHDLTPAGQRDAFKVGLLPPDAKGVARLRGSVGGDVRGAYVKTTVPDPPLYFGLALQAALARAGIALEGRVRPPAEGEKLPDKARVLYTRRSPLLPALVLCGKESDNLIAEQLLRACAFVRYGHGSIANGARLVDELARELGLAEQPRRIVDGSGLSRDDVVTPALLAAVLARAYAAPWRDDYVRCLPISGVDGTLDRRMNEPAMQYRVRAKTGYIARVSGLSGYLLAGDPEGGDVFAFSFLMNGFKGGNAEMKKVQDDLCRALVSAAK